MPAPESETDTGTTNSGESITTPEAPRRNSSLFKKIGNALGVSPTKSRTTSETSGSANITPIKSPLERTTGPVEAAEMRQKISALQVSLEAAQAAEKTAKENLGNLENVLKSKVAQAEAVVTGEAVAGVRSMSLWSKVYFACAVLCTAFLVMLAGGSPVAAWLALTHEPTVGMDILMSTGTLDWKPAAAVGGLFCAISLACLVAVAGKAIRSPVSRAGFVALLAVDAAFYLHFQGQAKDFVRAHAVQGAAKAGVKLVYETDVPMLLVAVDALMLLGPGLLELALLHSRPQQLGGDIGKAVQAHLGWLRATLPLLRPVLFRGALLTAYTLSQHPDSAALKTCAAGACAATSKRTPLECSPPSSSVLDWLSHSMLGDSHSLQLDCHGNRPKVGQAEWLACRASFSPK
mmetsp:Transcript_36734/g.90415  ORF Transcript_36734/g.90415 Transcript_36734/m.90415 type:complete len:405 (+) Transcript_36734:181-1395(+)